MGLNNVSLWFANDIEENIITIDKAIKNKEYTCPLCGSIVVPKAQDSKYITSHFAHLDKSKCEGESIVHWWVKNQLLKVEDSIYVDDIEYIAKSIEIEKHIETSVGLYIPDIIIETLSGEEFYIEINYKNKKNVDTYRDIWNELKCKVVEIDVKNCINSSGVFECDNRFKLLEYNMTKAHNRKYNKFISELDNINITCDVKDNIKWFVRVCLSYNIDTLNIEELYDCYKYIYNNSNERTKKLISDLLSKNKCSNVYDEIIKHRLKIIKSQFSDVIYIECEDIDFCAFWNSSNDTTYGYDCLFGDRFYITRSINVNGFIRNCDECYVSMDDSKFVKEIFKSQAINNGCINIIMNKFKKLYKLVSVIDICKYIKHNMRILKIVSDICERFTFECEYKSNHIVFYNYGRVICHISLNNIINSSEESLINMCKELKTTHDTYVLILENFRYKKMSQLNKASVGYKDGVIDIVVNDTKFKILKEGIYYQEKLIKYNTVDEVVDIIGTYSDTDIDNLSIDTIKAIKKIRAVYEYELYTMCRISADTRNISLYVDENKLIATVRLTSNTTYKDIESEFSSKLREYLYN